MPYSDFMLAEVVRRFSLRVEEGRDLFAGVPERHPGSLLQAQLTENAPLAVAMQTEKARSELLIMPILLEVRRAMIGQVSLFSGAELTVDPSQGLIGVCDFLLTRSPHQVYLEAPILAIVEAKREDIIGTAGHCVATMIAAQRFNKRDGRTLPTVYGAVTTGDVWKFLTLRDTTVEVDAATYYLDRVAAILGVLMFVAGGRMTSAEVAIPSAGNG